MPRKKKISVFNSGVQPVNLNNFGEFYTEIDKEHFLPLYKEFGNDDGKLKIVETGLFPKYYILSKFLLK